MYTSIIGSLIYLATRTGPDMAVAASMLASHLQEPTNAHLVSAKLVRRYLRWAAHYDMKINRGRGTQLTVYVDASWCSEAEKRRRSRSGLVLKYSNAVVAATINLQKFVNLNSTEVEYVALSEASKTIVCLQNGPNELSFEKVSTKIHQDNAGCIVWGAGGAWRHFNTRRHIDVRQNNIMSLVKDGQITLIPTRTDELRADFVTTALLPGDLSCAITTA